MYNPVKGNIDVVRKKFALKEIECYSVFVDGSDYEECEKISCNFWSNSKGGAYGVGLGATPDDKYKPARTGMLAQMAFGKLTGLPVDNEFRHGGDDHDNLIFGYKVDIKCAMKFRDTVLIYHTNEWGKKIPLNKDIYVCGYVEKENRNEKNATVVLTGFALKQDVEKAKVEVGYKGKGHLNYVLPVSSLRSITKFVSLLNHKMEKNMS